MSRPRVSRTVTGIRARLFQGKYVHTLHNEGTVPLVVYAFYILPSGTENAVIRIDQPAPACPNIN